MSISGAFEGVSRSFLQAYDTTPKDFEHVPHLSAAQLAPNEIAGVMHELADRQVALERQSRTVYSLVT